MLMAFSQCTSVLFFKTSCVSEVVSRTCSMSPLKFDVRQPCFLLPVVMNDE
uniref:Uncharacterized protein n=1 Tax=Rhizophora mucronata TaxID=61149 RepID=A0A2P2PK19_RHIMU